MAAQRRGQMELALGKRKASWGGRREGAGRPKSGRKVGVVHRARPFHDKAHPVHVTYKAVTRRLREVKVTRELMKAIRAAHNRTFRIVHYSIQDDHLHMVVEAGSKTSLSRGLQGFASRAARYVNHELGREGRLWADRYHAHELSKPREVRNAIAYVLLNRAKHVGLEGVDQWSSGLWFDGWTERVDAPAAVRCPVRAPATWLLAVGWRRHGRIDPSPRDDPPFPAYEP